MTRIAIVGGGISGLSAALTLEERRRSGAAVDYVLYESSAQLGGVLHTESLDGCVLEAGPDSWLTEKPAAADLCRSLSLADQLIHSNDTARKTYILLRGRLVPLPDGLMFMVPTKLFSTGLSPLFSWKTKLQIASEFFRPPASLSSHVIPNTSSNVVIPNARGRAGEEPAFPSNATTPGAPFKPAFGLSGDFARVNNPPLPASATAPDESVAAFISRHYTSEMVDRLADPLLAGVYGGAAADLSVHAVLPRFAEMERTHGSLGRAMLATRKSAAHTTPRPIFTSLKNGTQQLVDAIAARLSPGSFVVNTPVLAIQPQSNAWRLTTDAQSTDFDALILAVPAHVAAQLLSSCAPELSAELGAIRSTSSITVALGFDGKVRHSLPPGFGFLIPRSENKRLLATTFVHNKFPHRAPPDRALLRCFFAGPSADSLWPLSDQQIVDLLRLELQQILGLAAPPLFSRVFRWKSAMPQYTVGHLDRLQRIDNCIAGRNDARPGADLPPLALAGNGYRGIGIPDCIRSGRDAADQILRTAG